MVNVSFIVLVGLLGIDSHGAITFTKPAGDNVDIPENTLDPGVVFTPTTPSTAPILWSVTVTPVDGKFRIYHDNGSLYYFGSPDFDHETTPQYTISLTATNVDSTHTEVFTATITNINEVPVITNLPATVAVEENWVPTAVTGDEIFELAGTDPDAGTTLIFSIDSVTPVSGVTYFGLDTTNQLKALPVALFNRENIPQYNLTILLKDASTGGLTATGLLTVDIIDLNETPFFNTSVGLTGTVEYDEELPIGTELNVVVPITGEIRAYDVDAGDTLTYELDGADQQYFEVKNVNGAAKLYMAERADYEARLPGNSISMNVRARDKAGEVTEPPFVLTMKIQNKNDNLPVCSPTEYTGTVTENMVAGSTILTVTCHDDDGDLDSYKIQDFTTADTLFEANAQTHALLVKSPPDIEQNTVITFILYAVQGLPDTQTSSSVSVTVTIQGTNDNRPRFDQSFYNFDIRSDASIATSVGRISAIDNDLTSSILSYDWVSVVQQFRLDPLDGRIRVQAAMTDNAKWVLFAVAKDNDNPPDYSDHLPMRIDAFPPAPYLVDFEVTKPISYFTDVRITEFLAAISSACSPCVGRFSSMVSTPGEEAIKTTLTVYALVDGTTNLYANIESNKYYIPKETMLAIFTTGISGTPSSATTVTAFHSYPVTKVTATIISMSVHEWFTQTGGGIALLCLFSLIGVGLITGGIFILYKFGVFSRSQPIEYNVRRPESLGNDDLFDYRYKDNNYNQTGLKRRQ